MAVEVRLFGVGCGVGAQQGRDIPNPLNEHGLTVLTNGLDDGFALIAIPDGDLHLDQFVIIQCPLEFLQHGRR